MGSQHHKRVPKLQSAHLADRGHAGFQKNLNYFSDYDPMKKVNWGRLYMEQGKTEEAYEKLENAVFSEYTTLNLAFSIMTAKALKEKNGAYARFLAEKMCTLAAVFDMGKYNQCAPLLNIVTAEKNVEDTFQVAKQLLENVDTICDFRESRLYQHMEFKTAENPYTREMKENLLTLFRDGEDFSYMKGYEPWEKLLGKS